MKKVEYEINIEGIEFKSVVYETKKQRNKKIFWMF